MKTKRIASLLLCLMLALSLLPAAAFAAKSSSDIVYSVTGGNIYFNASTGAITACDESVTEAVVPREINGVTVTTIGGDLLGGDGFTGCKKLTSVTLPVSLTTIAPTSFYNCPKLTDVYYVGTESQWDAIQTRDAVLIAAIKHFAGSSSETPAAPATPSAPDDGSHPTITLPANPPVLIVVLTKQNLTVDGAAKNTEIYNIDGSNYFKLRDMAALLNGTGSQFSVDFDAARSTIVVKTGAAYTQQSGDLQLGTDKSSTAAASAQSIEIDGKAADLTAYNIGGNNFFKLRDLGTALNFDVDYDGATSTMIVKSR